LFLILALWAWFKDGKLAYQTGCCSSIDYSGKIDFNSRKAFFEGKEIEVPAMVFDDSSADKLSQVLGSSSGERE